jgi:predicted DNA-binding protein (UPF0251 family)
MPRPPIERLIGAPPRATLFKPAGVPARDLERVPLALDELEAIRLVDLEGLSHEQAAAVMGVSRQTIGRILEQGRARVAEALVASKAILIGGGSYRVAPRRLCCLTCGNAWCTEETAVNATCPSCGSATVSTCWDPVGGCGIDPERREGGGGGDHGKGRGGHGKGPSGHAGPGREDAAPSRGEQPKRDAG